MRFLVLILNLLLIANNVFAQNSLQRELIDEPLRPSIEKILSDPRYYEVYKETSTVHTQAIAKQLPELLVSLEHAFPRGIYAYLGRDMDLIADVTEAFYLSNGYRNPVNRIRFSTPSLSGSDYRAIGEFLEQLGLSTDKSDIDPKPFVIIDYTGYSERGQTDRNYPSQARHITQCAIRYLNELGFTAEEIAKRIAVATFYKEAKKNVTIVDALDKNPNRPDPNFIYRHDNLNSLVWLNVDPRMGYESEWHGKYGSIERNRNGKLQTAPTEYFSTYDREVVFRGIVTVVNLVRDPEMNERISKLARQYGVEFSPNLQTAAAAAATIPSQKEKKPTNLDTEFKREAKNLFSALSDLPYGYEYSSKVKKPNMTMNLTENGLSVVNTLSSPRFVAAKTYFGISLNTLIRLFNDKKIGARDLRRIFAYLLTLKEIDNPAIVEMVSTRFDKVLPLEIMFGRAREREKYLGLPGFGEDNFRKILDVGKIGLSCKFLF